MSTTNKAMNEFARKELTSIVMRLTKAEEPQASQVSDDTVKVIDWNNSALMHKGLSWIAKNYLMKRNMM
nr:hypothetical protein [uncultured Blautia sp.]